MKIKLKSKNNNQNKVINLIQKNKKSFKTMKIQF